MFVLIFLIFLLLLAQVAASSIYVAKVAVTVIIGKFGTATSLLQNIVITPLDILVNLDLNHSLVKKQ